MTLSLSLVLFLFLSSEANLVFADVRVSGLYSYFDSEMGCGLHFPDLYVDLISSESYNLIQSGSWCHRCLDSGEGSVSVSISKFIDVLFKLRFLLSSCPVSLPPLSRLFCSSDETRCRVK